jgi:hypothetical protein
MEYFIHYVREVGLAERILLMRRTMYEIFDVNITNIIRLFCMGYEMKHHFEYYIPMTPLRIALIFVISLWNASDYLQCLSDCRFKSKIPPRTLSHPLYPLSMKTAP